MSQYETITARVQELIRKYGTRDPFVLAKELGIEVIWSDEWTKLKGMYFYMKRRRFICLNSNLDEQMKKIVCAHEIGHDQLHRHLAKEKALQEFAQLEEDIDTLNSYYMDGQWRNDFEADESGKLPKNLKRGVLSEDALFDLLEETDRLRNLLIAMDEED